jgi:hypothetical protein
VCDARGEMVYNFCMIWMYIARDYIVWHYSRAFVDIFVIWRNITHFIFNFFSIPLLLRTLFQPWKRIEAQRETRGFDPADWFQTVLVNVIMRFIGACMRLILIFFGLACVAAAVLIGLQFFVFWFFLPPTLCLLLVSSLKLLILP